MIALDDNIEDHPKFVSLSDSAFALWVRCIGYCRRNLTDGYIPEQAARARVRGAKPEKVIRELCSPPAGLPNGNPLWLKVLGGYQVHDYLVWNPSKEKVEAERADKRARAARGGQASGRTRAEQAAKRAASTKDEAASFDSASPLANADPIRSDPIREDLPERSSLQQKTKNPEPEAAASQLTERQAVILAELRAHPALSGVASAALAETIDGRAITAAKPLELVVQAIRDAAAHTPPGTRIEAIQRKVVAYCDNAKPPKSSGPGIQPVSDRWTPNVLTSPDQLPLAEPDDPMRFP